MIDSRSAAAGAGIELGLASRMTGIGAGCCGVTPLTAASCRGATGSAVPAAGLSRSAGISTML